MNDAQPQPLAGTCPTCKGEDGHHYMTCDQPNDQAAQELHGLGEQAKLPDDHYDERNPAEGNNELPPATEVQGNLVDLGEDQDQGEEFDEQKIPPTADDLASNEMLWLIAKTCHEANRAYCREVILDRSHLPWDETNEALRLSVYDGVVKHFENPELTPEQSHAAWLAYKQAEGWTFGNVKDLATKTHPCLLPYSQLHIHDRAKDHIFKAICNAMMGGAL